MILSVRASATLSPPKITGRRACVSSPRRDEHGDPRRQCNDSERQDPATVPADPGEHVSGVGRQFLLHAGSFLRDVLLAELHPLVDQADRHRALAHRGSHPLG
jgi:hypothetical protein